MNGMKNAQGKTPTQIFLAVIILAFFSTPVSAFWLEMEHPYPDNQDRNQLRTAWGSSGDNVYAVGDYGTLLHFNGVAWSDLSDNIPWSGTARNIYGIWGTAADNVYCAADTGVLYHYDGTAWNRLTTDTTNKFREVWGLSESDVYVVGDKATILHFDGTDGDNMTAPAGTPTLQGAWGTARDNMYFVGGTSKSDPQGSLEAVIVHYDGFNWTTQWTGLEAQKLKAVWGSTGTDIFAVGDGGTILHSTDGTSWSEVQHGFSYDGEIRSMWGNTATEIFASGDYTTILYYDGSQWIDARADIDPTVPTNLKLHGIWGSAPDDVVYAVGGDIGTILKYVPDYDSDGFSFPEDCNDNATDIHPATAEICDDAIDNNCDGEVDEDSCVTCIDGDGDGYSPIGTGCGQTDCDDSDNMTYPGAAEICDDGKDNDCDGDTDEGCTPAGDDDDDDSGGGGSSSPKTSTTTSSVAVTTSSTTTSTIEPTTSTTTSIEAPPPEDTTTSTTTTIRCVFTETLSLEGSKEIDVIRSFRDNRLQHTEAGLRFIYYYYRHATELIGILDSNPDIADPARGLSAALAAAIQSGIRADRQILFSEKQCNEIRMLLEDIDTHASAELHRAIESSLNTLKEDTFWNELGIMIK